MNTSNSSSSQYSQPNSLFGGGYHTSQANPPNFKPSSQNGFGPSSQTSTKSPSFGPNPSTQSQTQIGSSSSPPFMGSSHQTQPQLFGSSSSQQNQAPLFGFPSHTFPQYNQGNESQMFRSPNTSSMNGGIGEEHKRGRYVENEEDGSSSEDNIPKLKPSENSRQTQTFSNFSLQQRLVDLEKENVALRNELKNTKQVADKELNDMKTKLHSLKAQFDLMDRTVLQRHREVQQVLEKENRKLRKEIESLKKDHSSAFDPPNDLLPYYIKLVSKLKAQSASLQDQINSINSEKQSLVEEMNQMKQQYRSVVSQNEQLLQKIREVEDAKRTEQREAEIQKLRFQQEIHDLKMNKSFDTRSETAVLKSEIMNLESTINSQKETIRQLRRELERQKQEFQAHLQAALELLPEGESEAIQKTFNLLSPSEPHIHLPSANNLPSPEETVVSSKPRGNVKLNLQPQVSVFANEESIDSASLTRNSPTQPTPSLQPENQSVKTFENQPESNLKQDLRAIEKELQRLQQSLQQASLELGINAEFDEKK